jgi:hypothetical protein
MHRKGAMTNFLWLLLVVGGPVVIAIAIVYAFTRSRRLTPEERAAQERGTEELYRSDRRE